MAAMLAAITLAGAGAVALVAVALYALFRLLRWIWLWLDQSIIVSSWGVLLEGVDDEDAELELADLIWEELTETEIGRTQARDYLSIYWRGLQARAGLHPIGHDLYVSWNLMSRTNPLLKPKQSFGLTETNEMRAFANATLAATQRAVRRFLLPHGQELPKDRLAPSGMLGELPGTVPKKSGDGKDPPHRRGRAQRQR